MFTEEFRRGVGRCGMLAGVGCKKTLIDLANGSFFPQNILHPAHILEFSSPKK